MLIHNKPFFCSWSGGKDSCLSLYYAIKQGGIPKRLVTMLIKNGKRSRSHGLSMKLLQKQSKLLNIPLITDATSWGDYEENFISVLKELKKSGISIGVFGDIDIEDHRIWVKNVCDRTNILEYFPLWKKPRRKIVEEFIEAGFKAIIVAVKEDIYRGKELLGSEINEKLICTLEKRGIDVAGENGEYHTLVIGGPIFSKELEYKVGKVILSNGYWFQDVSVVK